MCFSPVGYINLGKHAPASRWLVLAALVWVFGMFSCTTVKQPQSVVAKALQNEVLATDVEESTGLNEKRYVLPAPSWSAGEDLKFWYKDLGNNILLITRSRTPNRVVIHVDVNQNGIRDRGVDRAYGIGIDGKIHTEFSRPPWMTAAWDEIPTKGRGTERNSTGSSIETVWILPKEELCECRDEARISFELFNEEYQSSKYLPGRPFKSVFRLKYSSPWPPPGETASSSDAGATHPQLSPSIASFIAHPETIDKGDSTTLRWVVKNAKNARIEPGLDNALGRDEMQVSPEKTTLYTLIAEGAGGAQASRQLLVNVNPPKAAPTPPAIVAFQGDAASIRTGGTTLLRWSVSGMVTGIRIDPGMEALPAQGQREVSPAQSTEYILTAEGPGGKASSQFTVSVKPPPAPSIVFNAEPVSIIQGQNSTLQWSTSDATTVSIAPDLGGTNASGRVMVKPLYTTRYTLTAKGPGGEAARDVTIFVSLPAKSTGELTWTGNIHGTQLVTIDKDHADIGTLSGSLPGVPCIIQPLDERKVGIASTPSPSNNYERLVLRVTGNGTMRVVIKWSLQ